MRRQSGFIFEGTFLMVFSLRPEYSKNNCHFFHCPLFTGVQVARQGISKSAQQTLTARWDWAWWCSSGVLCWGLPWLGMAPLGVAHLRQTECICKLCSLLFAQWTVSKDNLTFGPNHQHYIWAGTERLAMNNLFQQWGFSQTQVLKISLLKP